MLTAILAILQLVALAFVWRYRYRAGLRKAHAHWQHAAEGWKLQTTMAHASEAAWYANWRAAEDNAKRTTHLAEVQCNAFDRDRLKAVASARRGWKEARRQRERADVAEFCLQLEQAEVERLKALNLRAVEY